MLEGAASIGQSAPVKGSAGVKALMAQFQAIHRFASKAQLQQDPSLLKSGMIVFFDRATPQNPWMGHVELCEIHDPASDAFQDIGGNTGPNGDRVTKTQRKISDPKFLGCAWLD
jgi:hypothetical protein